VDSNNQVVSNPALFVDFTLTIVGQPLPTTTVTNTPLPSNTPTITPTRTPTRTRTRTNTPLSGTNTPTNTPTVTPTGTRDCTQAWRVVTSPNFGSGNNRLYGVAAISPTDIWAVGRAANGTGEQTLTEHWDGNAWSIVPSPNATSGFNYLQGVSASSSGDVWAVGFACDGDCFAGGPNSGSQSLILHWDGV